MDDMIVQAVQEVNRKYKPTKGKCMEASNKLVSILKKKGFAAERQAGLYFSIPHNWVVLGDEKTILDPTADQFRGPLIPTETGHYLAFNEKELSWLSFWAQQSRGIEHLVRLRDAGVPTTIYGGQDLDETRTDRRGVEYRYVSKSWELTVGRVFMSAVIYEYAKSKLIGVCANYRHREYHVATGYVEYTKQTWYYFQPKSGTWFIKKAGKFAFTDQDPGSEVGIMPQEITHDEPHVWGTGFS